MGCIRRARESVAFVLLIAGCGLLDDGGSGCAPLWGSCETDGDCGELNETGETGETGEESPEPPEHEPSWEDCDDLTPAHEAEVQVMIGHAHAAVSQVQRGATARDQLVWEAIGGLRRQLLTPAAVVGGTSTGGDTSTGGGTGSSTGGGTTSTGGGTTTGGESPEPQNSPWSFEEGTYRFSQDTLTVEVVASPTEPQPLGDPGEVLVRDLRRVDSYFTGYQFVPDVEGEEGLASVGQAFFDGLGEYFALLGLPDTILSPTTLTRDEFLDLSEGFSSQVYLPLRWTAPNAVTRWSSSEGDADVSIMAESNGPTLAGVFVGSAASWVIEAFDVERPGHVATLAEGELWYRSAGYHEVVYPSEPSFESGEIYGEVRLLVEGPGFDYHLTFQYFADDPQPEVRVDCQ